MQALSNIIDHLENVVKMDCCYWNWMDFLMLYRKQLEKLWYFPTHQYIYRPEKIVNGNGAKSEKVNSCDDT